MYMVLSLGVCMSRLPKITTTSPFQSSPQTNHHGSHSFSSLLEWVTTSVNHHCSPGGRLENRAVSASRWLVLPGWSGLRRWRMTAYTMVLSLRLFFRSLCCLPSSFLKNSANLLQDLHVLQPNHLRHPCINPGPLLCVRGWWRRNWNGVRWPSHWM